MNSRGKIVSKKSSASKAKAWKKNPLSKWIKAIKQAREELGLSGFVACKKGTAYYKLAKKIYTA